MQTKAEKVLDVFIRFTPTNRSLTGKGEGGVMSHSLARSPNTKGYGLQGAGKTP